jgi:hypothetical protein
LEIRTFGEGDRVCAPHDLAAERRLGRVSSAADPHLVGILLFAITQLHALATHVQDPTATPAKATRQLRPFVSFLAATLTATDST